MRVLRLTILLFALAFAVSPSGVHSITINGTSARQQISTTASRAHALQVVAEPGNASTVRVGDTQTSSTVGLPVTATSTAAGSQFLPPLSGSEVYILTNVYIYVATGDKANVLWVD